ncbi:MAG: ATP-binding protein, partial [Akkermansiaceae bacterium]
FAAFGIPFFFRIREFKRLREMRNWISGDLHDEIGSNLGSIQVLSSFLKQEYPETHEEASTIERVAAETVNSVRDIVWLLRPQTRETAHTIEHLRDTAAILIEPAGWSFTTDIRGEDLLLDHEARRNLMLFFREALHNVSRHAKADHVEIHLGETEEMFQLSIADNGVGIPVEIQRLPRFLRALKERAQRLGGRLKIQAYVRQGTKITLTIPQRQTIRTSIQSAISRSRSKTQ